MKKRGISLISVSIAIVIMLILISVISVSLTYSITNAKKMTFAKEIYNIQNLVAEYVEREESLPVTNEVLQVNPSDRTQFTGETFTEDQIILNVVDLQLLGIKNTNYGNKELGDSQAQRAKDVYALSESTGKVYYIAGFEVDGKKYYTLTDELRQMIEKKQTFTVSEKTVTFTPSKIGWSAEGISVTAFVPSEFSSPSISINNSNITYTSSSSSEGIYYNINQGKLAEEYTVTITYTKNGSTHTATYSARMDNDYPVISKDININNTSDYVKGLEASDTTSGIKYFKYVEGAIEAHDVLDYIKAYGKKISNGSIKSFNKTVYTIYAEDKVGNYTIMWIDEDGELTDEKPVIPEGFVASKQWTLTDSNSNGLADIGEVVSCGSEQFYVIGGDIVGTAISGSTENVILLAKYNLTSDGSSQDTTGALNMCSFCSSTAWNDANVVDGDNLNNKQSIQADSTSAVAKAIAYGESLGVTGRLILKSEADSLNVSATSSVLYGQYETGKYLNYWIGIASQFGPEAGVWFVNGSGSNLGRREYSGGIYGVRPVLEVSASSMNKRR